jgi:multidrug efflux pump subunit AcrB
VLAATVSTSIVFFPVLLLYGVSKYLFTALASAVVMALFASYAVAMTVVPLFCARFITIDPGHESPAEMDADRAIDASAVKKRKIRIFRIVVDNFNLAFRRMESWYTRKVGEALEHAGMVVSVICACVLLSFVLYPFIGKAFFPRTDPGQFVVNVKVPAGTRIEVTDDYISKIFGAWFRLRISI